MTTPIASTGHRDSRPVLVALAVFAAVALGALIAAPAAEAQGFRLQGLSGGQLTDADLREGTTVVVVWASWSPKCKDIARQIDRIVDRWGGRARVVSVSFQEDREAVQAFLGGASMAAPVYLDTDGTFSKRHSITSLPGLLVVKDGNTVYRNRLPDDPDRILGEVLGR